MSVILGSHKNIELGLLKITSYLNFALLLASPVFGVQSGRRSQLSTASRNSLRHIVAFKFTMAM